MDSPVLSRTCFLICVLAMLPPQPQVCPALEAGLLFTPRPLGGRVKHCTVRALHLGLHHYSRDSQTCVHQNHPRACSVAFVLPLTSCVTLAGY